MNIQWYPGHMTKTKRLISQDIALVDIVLELLDARIPKSSKNPDIEELAKNKSIITIMNKADLSDEVTNIKWKNYYESMGNPVILANSLSKNARGSIFDQAAKLMKNKLEKQRSRGRTGSVTRVIVLGIPNVGKSTLINNQAGRQAAAAADRPGVTRGKQWIKINSDFELLDTPGILWPKFDDRDVGLKLACTGAVKDTVIDMIELSWELIGFLRPINPNLLKNRYKIQFDETALNENILELIGAARGFKQKGGVIDLERTAVMLIDEFRAGKLGRISLESPEFIRQIIN